jgi:histone deacetylase 6
VVQRFQSSGLAARCTLLQARPASDDEVLRAHSREHLEAVEALFEREGHPIQTRGDLFFNAHTAAAARLSAGCAVEATLSVCRGDLDAAFAVIRPPGHHAECARAMGFCFLNNASISALAALQQPGIERVLILDWDVHHGNGIEAIHYEDPRVLYVSLHRYSVAPATWFYPGTGAATDCGKGAGEGFTLNVPWPERGGGDADYLAAFELVIGPVARAFAPSLVLISAGFDAAEGDPLGGMCVTPGGYQAMAAHCASYAERGRCVALLEGGYNLEATAAAAEGALRGLLGEPAPPLSKRARPRRSTESVLRCVAKAQARYWPQLKGPTFRSALELHFAALHFAAAALSEPATPQRKPAADTPERAPRPAPRTQPEPAAADGADDSEAEAKAAEPRAAAAPATPE